MGFLTALGLFLLIAFGLAVVGIFLPPVLMYIMRYIEYFFKNIKLMKHYKREMGHDTRLYLRDIHKETVSEYDVKEIMDDKWEDNIYWFPVVNHVILVCLVIMYIWRFVWWLLGDLILLVVGCLCFGVGWLIKKLRFLRWIWKGPVIALRWIWNGLCNFVGGIRI